jgi:hypothetical protein
MTRYEPFRQAISRFLLFLSELTITLDATIFCLLTIEVIHVEELCLFRQLAVNRLLESVEADDLVVSVIIAIITLIAREIAGDDDDRAPQHFHLLDGAELFIKLR